MFWSAAKLQWITTRLILRPLPLRGGTRQMMPSMMSKSKTGNNTFPMTMHCLTFRTHTVLNTFPVELVDLNGLTLTGKTVTNTKPVDLNNKTFKQEQTVMNTFPVELQSLTFTINAAINTFPEELHSLTFTRQDRQEHFP